MKMIVKANAKSSVKDREGKELPCRCFDSNGALIPHDKFTEYDYDPHLMSLVTSGDLILGKPSPTTKEKDAK
jgi:hypothetical protein